MIPASERGHVDYVRRVVTTGIDVDHVNRLGWTALLEAVILGDGGEAHQEIVRILLAAGADPSIADGDGVTALEHARARVLRRDRCAARGRLSFAVQPHPAAQIRPYAHPKGRHRSCSGPGHVATIHVDARTTPDRYFVATLPDIRSRGRA